MAKFYGAMLLQGRPKKMTLQLAKFCTDSWNICNTQAGNFRKFLHCFLSSDNFGRNYFLDSGFYFMCVCIGFSMAAGDFLSE